MTTHIIIFNGPPGSGKDECAKILMRNAPAFHLDRFSAPAKATIPTILGMDEAALEASKDEAVMGVCKGLSYRQLQISFFEDWLKPTLGQDAAGTLLAMRILQSSRTYWVVPDSGFISELVALQRILENAERRHHIDLIRIHRPGYTYAAKKDSRGYLEPDDLSKIPNLTWWDLENDEGLEQLELEILPLIPAM